MMKHRTNLPYSEGTCFAVPLRDSGFAKGIVSRYDGEGIVAGFFFGPRHLALPTPVDFDSLHANGAMYVGRFGDLGLLNGEWPIVGTVVPWHRYDWSLPPMGRVEDVSRRGILSSYSDKLVRISEIPCEIGELSRYPPDVLSGYGAIEIKLTRLLSRSDDARVSMKG